MSSKPWDSRVAHALVAPLVSTPVHPNHVTTLGLLLGLGAAIGYAMGPDGAGWGALLFVVSSVVDHADGELARATGKTSEFGHTYDRIVDLIVKTSLFTGMGVGLAGGPLGSVAIPMGLIAGVSLVAIFTLRGARAKRVGKAAFEQPSYAGFELEDILYLIAPVTWLGGLETFFSLAAVGIPAFAAWSAFLWWRDR